MNRLLSISVALALVCSASLAKADANACAGAAEAGQRARASGRLREARERLVECSAEECGGLARDCGGWALEVLSQMPTIVVEAKDANGGDLEAVTVVLDDKVIASRIDGKAIAIDPGQHTLRFEHKGFAPITQAITAKEGEKSRIVSVAFGDRMGPPLPRRGLISSRPTGNGHSILPWVVAGAGLVAVGAGIALVATTPSFPGNCDKAKETCERRPGESDESLADRREDAGRSLAQPVWGVVILAGGGACIVGGLLWHFIESNDATPAAKSKPKVSPWIADGTGGVSLAGAF